jgi:hypothetical protein
MHVGALFTFKPRNVMLAAFFGVLFIATNCRAMLEERSFVDLKTPTKIHSGKTKL